MPVEIPHHNGRVPAPPYRECLDELRQILESEGSVGLLLIDGSQLALRAVAVSEGRTIGRAQARVSPIGNSGNLLERLVRAPGSWWFSAPASTATPTAVTSS